MDNPSEVTTPHTQLLRCALEIDESFAYLAHVVPGSTPDLATVWPDKTPARLPLLRRQMDRRFAAYPHAHEVLHAWAPTMEASIRPIVCHWHLQLADPIYRAFTVNLRTRSAVDLHTVNDEFLEPFDTSGWSPATRLQLASKLLSCALEAGLIAGNRGYRATQTPDLPPVAIAYLAHLLERVTFDGTATDNPYVASVGLTREAFKTTPRIHVTRNTFLLDEPFEPAQYAAKVTDARVAESVIVDDEIARVVDLPLRAWIPCEPLPEPVQQSFMLDDDGLNAIADRVMARMEKFWSPPPKDPNAPTEPEDAWKAFFNEKMLTISKKPAKVSTYRGAWADFISRGGPSWPFGSRLAGFSKFCRDRLSGPYASGRVRVLEEWRAWCLERNLYDPDSEPEVIAPLVALDMNPNTVSLAGPPEHGTVGRLHPDDIAAIATLAGERATAGVSGALWGGEASEDYWATLTRHVVSRFGLDVIAARCRIDTTTAEEYVRKKQFPVFARPRIERLYGLLLLRKWRLAGEDITDIIDEVDDVEIIGRQSNDMDLG